jgi:hypothetical protein
MQIPATISHHPNLMPIRSVPVDRIGDRQPGAAAAKEVSVSANPVVALTLSNPIWSTNA